MAMIHHPFVKFVKLFHRQSFALYGSYLVKHKMKLYVSGVFWKID